MDIRKISIGADYKNNAMHYIVGQSVISNMYSISHIIQTNSEYQVWIEGDGETMLWKSFTGTMPISVEYNINF